MPVALYTVGPVGSQIVKLHWLPVPDHVVAPIVVDLGPGVGTCVPLLDGHYHVLHSCTENYHLAYLGGSPGDRLVPLLAVML